MVDAMERLCTAHAFVMYISSTQYSGLKAAAYIVDNSYFLGNVAIALVLFRLLVYFLNNEHGEKCFGLYFRLSSFVRTTRTFVFRFNSSSKTKLTVVIDNTCLSRSPLSK
jgi:hypothetical protein